MSCISLYSGHFSELLFLIERTQRFLVPQCVFLRYFSFPSVEHAS